MASRSINQALPNELLSRILDGFPLRELVTLARVCKFWNQLVIAHPTYWSYVVLNHHTPSAVDFFLLRIRRAEGRLIAVEINIPYASPAVPRTLSTLSAHLWQIQKLSLCAHIWHADAVLRSVCVPAPNLEDLRLSFANRTVDMIPEDLPPQTELPTLPHDFLGRNAPKLQSCYLDMVHLPVYPLECFSAVNSAMYSCTLTREVTHIDVHRLFPSLRSLATGLNIRITIDSSGWERLSSWQCCLDTFLSTPNRAEAQQVLKHLAIAGFGHDLDTLSLGLVGGLTLELSWARTRILARLSDTDSRHIRETLNNTLNFESSHGPPWIPLGLTTVPFTITTSLAERLVRMALPLSAAPFVQHTTLCLPSLVELDIEVTAEYVDLELGRFARPEAPFRVPALRKLSLLAETSVPVAVTTTAAEELVLEGLIGVVIPVHLSVTGVVLVGEWRNPRPVILHDG